MKIETIGKIMITLGLINVMFWIAYILIRVLG